MSKKDLKYIAILLSTVIAFVLIEFFTPEPIDWRITLAKKDKIPFGTYVLHDLMGAFMSNASLAHSNATLYELDDEISPSSIVLILTTQINMDIQDTETLLDKVDQGATAIIAAQYFSGKLADTLNLEVGDHLMDIDLNNLSKKDTSYFYLTNRSFSQNNRIQFRKDHFPTYFTSVDSSKSVVTITDQEDNILGIRVPHGKGTLYLSTTPLMFTNNYLLDSENQVLISDYLSYLPEQNVLWTEYYQLGRMESSSPLRFILGSASLKWAYYALLVGLVLLLFFESKRRQRAIPVVKPYPNTSLEFASVIGNLYLQNGEYQKIAIKRIHFFLEQIRQKYYLSRVTFSEDFYNTLAAKSGNDKAQVSKLFGTIERCQQAQRISEQELQQLSQQIDLFMGHK